MKRRTSTTPIRVYKYAVLPPREMADEAAQSFENARRYYNSLVTIENRRRYLYRAARARLCPDVGALEAEIASVTAELAEARAVASAAKAATRTRAVAPATSAAVKVIIARLRGLRARHKEAREVANASPELATASVAINTEANDAIKALRQTLYWGTYLLVEAAVKQAASKSKGDLAYNTDPAHLLSSRIGVHWVGGCSVESLTDGTNTLMQIENPPTWRQTPSGKWRQQRQRGGDGSIIHCSLKFRIGSNVRAPKFAVFPLVFDRPLPADGRIKDAYITRRHLRERNPWEYHLCIVLESSTFERTEFHANQKENTTINFGWRQFADGSLRVATINRGSHTPEFVTLDAPYVAGHRKACELQSLLDTKFDAVKKALGTWISANTSHLPEAFVSTFHGLPQWKSQHRLCELARYWSEHRVPDDDDIFETVQRWRERYLHLYDWMVSQRRHLLRQRADLFGCAAKKIVSTSASITMDTFGIADVAKRAKPEEEETGIQRARRNRVIAAPGELREAIIRAAKTYHCEVMATSATNTTRRCNICGHVEPGSIIELDHECSACPAEWDQDKNNTENLHTRLASGEVVQFVMPAKTAENGDVVQAKNKNYDTARKELRKMA